MRTFEDKPAVRERVPLLIGLMGPSGGGKTFSALRLATGIQSVTSDGPIFVIDTEARRALHYADHFQFRHVAFGAPFGPLDYLAAIEHCVKQGAGTIIVDSMSHEHEGPGGVLEMHSAEVARMSRGDERKAERVKMLAWQKPKQDRRRLINTVLQIPVNFIFCFRAKEKMKLQPGREPVQLGWMPIAGDEFVYEMALNCLLLPNANGVPTLSSNEPGEQQMIKVPGWARKIVTPGVALDEHMGAELAKWAAGVVPRSAEEVIADYERCADPGTLGMLNREAKALWPKANRDQREAFRAARDAAEARIREAEASSSDGSDEPND